MSTPTYEKNSGSPPLDNRRWARGPRLNFLEKRLSAWREAQDRGDASTFYNNVTLLWIKTYDWEHAFSDNDERLIQEASEDHLDAVLSTTGLSADEIKRRSIAFVKLRSVSFRICGNSHIAFLIHHRKLPAGIATMGRSP